MKLFKLLISIITSVLLFANVSLAEKWDMALAYGAGNFHSANATEFAKNVTDKSGGKLTSFNRLLTSSIYIFYFFCSLLEE